MKFKFLSLYSILCVILVMVSSANAQPALSPQPLAYVGEGSRSLPPDSGGADSQIRKIDPSTLNAEANKDKGGVNQHGQATSEIKRIYYEKEFVETGHALALSQKALYIVQLADEPLATYKGGVRGFRATSPRAIGENKLNVRSTASRAYRGYLADKRSEFKQAAAKEIGQALHVVYDYDVVFNGVAILATPQEAAKLLNVNGVLTLQRDQWRHATTNDSTVFLGVPGVWDGSGTGMAGTKGEGVIVGVIDTGIWPEHPSFKDDGTFPAPPASWPKEGVCDAPESKVNMGGQIPFDPYGYTCNNKLIGVQYFLGGYAASGYDGLFYSGRDDDGHGTHTASTAAGNENVAVSLYGINRGKISGMAPRAHVAVYKGLGPQGGTSADLTAAINKAVEDGVDVINYSVGSDTANDPWVDSDALSYLAAREAGVFVATSAGNDGGNGPSTIGSPANSPWVMTVGASSFNRLYLSDITITSTGALTAPMGLYGATMTPGITNFNLVDAKGVADAEGDSSGACLNPFLPGSFQATDVVLCPRGGIGTWIKGSFVNAGGAGAIIIYNSADNADLMSYLHAIPTVYIYRQDGLVLKDYIKQHQGKVTVSFTAGEKAFGPADPRIPVDTVVSFSSRGPNINEYNNELINTLKPDVTAPGLNILAGASPQHISVDGMYADRYGAQGQLFQNIQGTSMSSPHVAGLGALMKALYPKWTPSQIQSALMSTAVDVNQKARFSEINDKAATWFDMGAGRVDMRTAPKAGFVLDETEANYQAANPGAGGDPATLNIASLAQAKCLGQCGWARQIQSSMNSAVNWTVMVTGAAASQITVTPATFSLAANAMQTLNFTATTTGLPLNQWAFAEVIFTPDNAQVAVAHFPLAVKPSAGQVPVAAVTIDTRRNKGASMIEGVKSLATNGLQAMAYMGVPVLAEATITEDSNNGDAYDDLTDGVYIKTFEVPAGSKGAVVAILDSSADDMDMFVGLDKNGDGKPSADEKLCASTSGSWNEICTFPMTGKPLKTGTYWVLVQNWAGIESGGDTFTLSTTVVSGTVSSEVVLTAPSTVALNTPFEIQVAWDIPTFKAGQRKFAIVEIGTAAATPTDVASLSLTINRLDDDVTITSNSTEYALPGDTLEYTVNIQPELTVKADSIQYDFTAKLPTGLTYVADSASITPTQMNGQLISWSVNVPNPGKYVMTTHDDDAACDTPFGNGGGYVNLADFGIMPRAAISGNNVSYNFNELSHSTDPVNFYGTEHGNGFSFTDDGFASFNQELGNRANVDIPNAADPNNLVAPFWRDLAVVYDPDNNRGVSLAPRSGYLITQYSGVEPAPVGSSSDRYNFEMIISSQVDDTPGAYEIVFAYDDMDGALTPATIGLENANASQFVKVAYNDAQVKKGSIICFDYVPKVQVTFQAVVDTNITRPSELTVEVNHTIPGSSALIAKSDTVFVPETLLGISLDAPLVVAKGQNIEYTFTVNNGGSVAANNLKVVTNLPAGTSHVSGGKVMTSEVVFENVNVAAGDSSVMKMVVKPNPPVTSTTRSNTVTPRDPKIIGGIVAKPGAWPWQVALMSAGVENGFEAQFCGGSLIAPDWVLTAAHCVHGNKPSDLDVTVGRLTLSSNEGQRIPISQIVMNSKYTPNIDPPDYDIALVRLAQPVQLNGTTVATVSLLTAVTEGLSDPNTLAVVTGWGDTSNGEDDYADELHQVTVPIVSNETCSAAYDALNYDFGVITPRIICAGYVEGGKDACYGDSGGPLVVSNGRGGWLQTGIVSSGYECAQPEAYGTYTRVSQFTNWIEQAMNTYTIDYYYVTDGTDKVGHRADGDTTATNVSTLVKDMVDSTAVRQAVTVDGMRRHLQALDNISRGLSAKGNQTYLPWLIHTGAVSTTETYANAAINQQQIEAPTRAAGTVGFAKSGAYVMEMLKAAGYKPITHSFSYTGWHEVTPSTLEMTAPTTQVYTNAELDAETGVFRAMSYSGNGDKTAEVQAVDLSIDAPSATSSGCEAEDFATFTAGKIALIQRGVCTFAVKVTHAQDAGAVGVIIFNQGTPGREPVFGGTLGGPVATVPVFGTSFELGKSIATQLSGGQTVKLHLVANTVTELVNSYNIIAETPGGNPDNVVMAGGHLDSVRAGPGINDNGTGTAVLLELAIQMAKLEMQTTNKVRFAWWGGEEDGLVGSTDYVASLSPAELARINVYLNFDMIGSPNYMRGVYQLAEPRLTELEIAKVFKDYFNGQKLAWDESPDSGRSDHGPFLEVGVPVGGLFTGAEEKMTAEQAAKYPHGKVEVALDHCYHEACDDISNVNFTALGEMGGAVVHAIYTFSMDKALTARLVEAKQQRAAAKIQPIRYASSLDHVCHQPSAAEAALEVGVRE